MQAVILAAGTASRLRPLTDNCPKCLLEINGQTLLERTINAIVEANIQEITIITGYKAEMIREFLLKKFPHLTFHFIHNTAYATTNNIYSLWLAREQVDGKDFLLMDSDIYCESALISMIAQQPESALAVERHEMGEEEMKVITDENGNIVEISKTCSPKMALGESVGVENIKSDYATTLFNELEIMCAKEGLENKFYELAFLRLIKKGYHLKVVDTTHLKSMELDTVDDFHRAEQLKWF